MPAPAAVGLIAKGVAGFVAGFQNTALPSSEWTREELAAVNEPSLTAIERRGLRLLISGTGPMRGGTNAIFTLLPQTSPLWSKIARHAPPPIVETALPPAASVTTREVRATSIPLPAANAAQQATVDAPGALGSVAPEPSRLVPVWIGAGALLIILLTLRS